MTWQQEKATTMIEREIDNISRSPFPNDEICTGYIQMAFALGLIDAIEELEYSERSANVVRSRRKELREKKLEALGRVAA